jgi:hypothetical protein
VQDQRSLLRDALNLDELLQAASSKPKDSKLSVSNMPSEELNRIKDIIRRHNDFADARGRTQLIIQAGLHKILENFEYVGRPRTVAGELVDALIRYGTLKDEPGSHALGVLLCYVSSLQDLPPTDAEFLKVTINKYCLVSHGLCSKK